MAILIWSRGVISITRCEMARRREAEEAASQSRRRLQTILDHEPEGVIVCSADTTIRQINPSGMHLLELASIDGAIGRRFTSFAGIGRADGFVAWLQQIAAGQAGQFTMQLVGERGTERWVNLHGVPLRASDAPVNEVLLVARDITAARAAEIEREALQQQLVEASRQAGMADIATGVLHNVGNVLNTINISVHVLTDKLRGSRVPALSRAADLLSAQRDTLEAFLTADERGRQFPEYLSKTAGALRLEHEEMLGSIRSIAEGLDHIKAIVQSQQTFATGVGVEQSLRPAAVFEEALKLNIASCERHQVLIERDFHELPPASLDKHKTLQVLINLINNAKNAVTMAGSGQRRIFLRLRGGEMNGAPSVRFEVSDEGVGIEPHNMTRIFNMRFTTRADGHGFGLHSSANAAQEMGGNLTAHSEGAGRGATFVLELPAVKVKVAA
jgi:PAS domain S-box-containing protein